MINNVVRIWSWPNFLSRLDVREKERLRELDGRKEKGEIKREVN